MRIKKKEEDEYAITPECLEDLWYLTKIVEAGDAASGTSFRRFKTQDAEQDSGEKKKIRVELAVESVEFAESANKLRLTGVIIAGTPEEFVQKGSHHTLDVETHKPFTLKKHLTAYHKSVLDDAKKSAGRVKAAIVVMDEHQALLAELQAKGVKFLFEVTNHANKRQPERYDEEVKAYYGEIARAIEGKEKIIVAGPGFAREEFQRYLKQKNQKLLEKTGFEHCSTAEKTGVYELLKKGVVERLLGEQKAAKEYGLLEELKKSIAKEDGMACYGLEDVKTAVHAKAAKVLMVPDELLRKNKEVNELAENAVKTGAELAVFDSESDQGMELKGIGIAALLRYAIK